MLILPDSTHLGDKKLSAEEKLKQSFEQTDHMLDRYRLDDHETLKDQAARMGTPMHHNELIRKVTALNASVWAEDSLTNPTTVIGFYTKLPDGSKKYLGSFEKGFLPEFSYVLVDAADLPIKEKRGWRTVLLRLLKQGVLSWGQIKAAFGDSMHVSSERWRRETQKYRING